MCDVKIDSKNFASEFTVCWEHEFPSEQDMSSCGLLILMYAGTELGLIIIERWKETNVRLRNIVASELLQCRLEPHKNRENKQPACKVFSSCKQASGGYVILHCKAIGREPKEFQWFFNNEIVSRGQIYKFRITNGQTGTYICKLIYDDKKC